jgi:hypothetical protein
LLITGLALFFEESIFHAEGLCNNVPTRLFRLFRIDQTDQIALAKKGFQEVSYGFEINFENSIQLMYKLRLTYLIQTASAKWWVCWVVGDFRNPIFNLGFLFL